MASPTIIGRVLPVKIESLERYSLLGELASRLPMLAAAAETMPATHPSETRMGA
jgi:tRNA-2-methylthio-N6-dimethylallyladenosine synthase